jgi:HAD superfamily hydrolase (TIGR01662 family)
MVIKAVIFDVDGVLVDSFDANLKFIQDLLKKAGRKPITRIQYKKDGFHRTLHDVIRIYGSCKNEREVKDVLKLVNKVKHHPELFVFPPRLDETIRKLSETYKLAIVTGRIKVGVEDIFNHSKIRGYFPVVVFYGQYKNPKPDPESLLLAAKRLKIKPQESVYVGDSITDIQAAKTAGMKIILFSKRKIGKADAKTARFSELPYLIKNL